MSCSSSSLLSTYFYFFTIKIMLQNLKKIRKITLSVEYFSENGLKQLRIAPGSLSFKQYT